MRLVDEVHENGACVAALFVKQSLTVASKVSKVRRGSSALGGRRMQFIWTIIIGFIAGVIAKFIMPGPNEPQGFILTTILGIVGAFVATYLGQAIGWYKAGEGAGFIGAIVGAAIVLAIWGFISSRSTRA